MATDIPEYDELRLRVEPDGGETYQVVAFGPGGATASGHFTNPISTSALDDFVRGVGRPGDEPEDGTSPMEEAKRLGETLFKALLIDQVRDVYNSARGAADSQGRGLRISLSMTGAPELLELPWEFLYDPGEAFFLSKSIYTPVVRSLDLKRPPPPRPVTLPLQVLALVSSPAGFASLDVDAEREKLKQALGPLEASGTVRLEWLESATFGELDGRTGEPDEIHVIHYIGHGAYDKRTEGGILVFEDAHGGPHEVTGQDLDACVRGERSLRLVVLNSCEGARASHIDPFSGMASSLLRSGLPAVVAMQTEITDTAAIAFSDRLYTALAQGFPIDAALVHGRRAIFAAGGGLEFGTPVLFMRVADGRIFDVTGGPSPPEEGRLDVVLHAKRAGSVLRGVITWHLQIRNTGPCALSEVTARDSTGRTRAGPLDLARGETEDCTWAVAVERLVDESVTVGGRDPDGRLVSAQAGAYVSVPDRRLLAGAAVVVLVVIVSLVLVATGVLDPDDDETGLQVFGVGAEVADIDARGDKVAFTAPAPERSESTLNRLDLSGAEHEELDRAQFPYDGIDIGIDRAGHARLVYSRCDGPESCALSMRSFTGPEQPVVIPPPGCKDSRPSTWNGLVLFNRSGPSCDAAGLWLTRANSPQPTRVAGSTFGADLNQGRLAWRGDGQLVVMRVRSGPVVIPEGRLKPAGGGTFQPPLVVEGEHLYFVHRQGTSHFIARVELPLREATIDHYSPKGDVGPAPEAPHFGVTGETLYITNYPGPNGGEGSRVVMRVDEPQFEPASGEVATVLPPPG